MFRFVARFARVRIEESSRNRFALNGIQRDFFGGNFSGRIFVGGILSGHRLERAMMQCFDRARIFRRETLHRPKKMSVSVRLGGYVMSNKAKLGFLLQRTVPRQKILEPF